MLANARAQDKAPVFSDGVPVTFKREPRVIDGNLHLWLGHRVQGRERLTDPHFVVVNPPVTVPDGTFSERITPDGEIVYYPNFVEDPAAAFHVVVDRLVKDFKRKHP